MAGTSSGKTGKAAVLDRSLRGMFRNLARRPIPEHIRVVVDQLDAFDAQPLKKSG